MKLETIKKDKRKKIIIGSMIILSVVGCLTLTTTRAKYRNVQSLKLASGRVNYKVTDLHIVAIRTSEDGTNYTEQTEIPASGYTLNTEKSKCRIPDSTLTGENAPADETIPIEYRDGRVYIGVNKKNTKCYLYFDKIQVQTLSSIIAAIEESPSYKKESTPDFTQVATGTETEVNNGIYMADDPMYATDDNPNPKSYYWRGAATTNHVIFDNKCWRIVRINGDGSIRLIYNGTPSENICPGNGENSSSVALSKIAYNETSNNSKYVGWTYASGDSQRPSNTSPQTGGTPTSLKTVLETWYSNNITNKSKIVKGNFCNDRNTRNNETWRATGAEQYYAVYQRLASGTKTPTLSCPNGDVYSLDVGMITADEAAYAGGGHGETMKNTSYYLYNGQHYWTMSPVYWNGYNTQVLCVLTDGYLQSSTLKTPYSVRPVINLRSDVTFNSNSDGTQNNPYIVQ